MDKYTYEQKLEREREREKFARNWVTVHHRSERKAYLCFVSSSRLAARSNHLARQERRTYLLLFSG